MSLEDAIGLGFTIALTDFFSKQADAIAGKMRDLAKEATGSTAIVPAGAEKSTRQSIRRPSG